LLLTALSDRRFLFALFLTLLITCHTFKHTSPLCALPTNQLHIYWAQFFSRPHAAHVHFTTLFSPPLQLMFNLQVGRMKYPYPRKFVSTNIPYRLYTCLRVEYCSNYDIPCTNRNVYGFVMPITVHINEPRGFKLMSSESRYLLK
jgi:hypothetical protein